MTRPTETPANVIEQDGELIAFASTKGTGRFNRSRWTELAVWYLHNPTMGGKRWLAQVSGMSAVSGENNRHTRLASGSLERALKLIDQASDVGIATVETAREWAEDNRVTVENGRKGPVQFDTDRKALAWLYGNDPSFNGFPTLLARDLGANASTARMQLAGDRPVMVPLRAVLPYIDRAAFRRAHIPTAADKIAAGLEDAIAYVAGDTSRGRVANNG